MCTVESNMNVTDQTIMRTCYKPGKLFPLVSGNERRPEDKTEELGAEKSRSWCLQSLRSAVYMLRNETVTQ